MTENVKRFFEELETNDKAMELLKAASVDGKEPGSAALADIARQTGYDVTDEDVQACLEQLQQTTAAASDAVAEKLGELSPDEMELAAGGKDHETCKDTYRDGENCWYNDSCNKVNILYWVEKKGTCDSNTYCAKTLKRPDCDYGRIGLW